MVAHSPTYETFLQSPTSHPLWTSSSFVALYSAFHRPESHWRTSPPRLSQSTGRKQALLSISIMNRSLLHSDFFDLTCQTPKLFPHRCCRDIHATYQTVAEKGNASCFQMTLYLSPYFWENAFYARHHFAKEHVLVAQSSSQPFSLSRGLSSPS